MADRRFAVMFRELVKQIGGLEAAAAQIEAATGEEAHISLLSRMQNGSMNVALSWAWALEDGSGNRCFTRMRQRMVEARDVETTAEMLSPLDHASATHKESTEAIQALIDFSRDRQKPEVTLKELIEGEEAFRRAREDFEAQIRASVVSRRSQPA